MKLDIKSAAPIFEHCFKEIQLLLRVPSVRGVFSLPHIKPEKHPWLTPFDLRTGFGMDDALSEIYP